jgi:hypothetical protein
MHSLGHWPARNSGGRGNRGLQNGQPLLRWQRHHPHPEHGFVRTSMSVYGCQTFSASLRRVACQFGYRRCGRVARRRQVAEAVGSSSHLTPRWREVDSNFRFRREPTKRGGHAIVPASPGQHNRAAAGGCSVFRARTLHWRMPMRLSALRIDDGTNTLGCLPLERMPAPIRQRLRHATLAPMPIAVRLWRSS